MSTGLRAVASVIVIAAWVALGYGLLATPWKPHAQDELEAGGRLAMNVAVYLPYLALTLVVGLVALLGLFPRPRTVWPLAVTVGGAALFGLWVLAYQPLTEAKPELTTWALASVLLQGLAGALLAGSVASRAPAVSYPASAVRGEDGRDRSSRAV